MTESKWKYVKKLINNDNIQRFEQKIHRDLPIDFKETVALFNGGRPDKSNVLIDNKERILKSLLSFNKEDKENIFAVYEWVESQLERNLIPFAIDPAGNYFCFEYTNFKNVSIVFWNHENQNHYTICDTFSELLHKLY